MVDPTFTHGGLGPVERANPTAGAPQRTEANGPAFQALLEKLENQARNIEAAGQETLKPEELAGAVDRARTSLTDALSLGDQLIEAYRAAQQQPEQGGSEG